MTSLRGFPGAHYAAPAQEAALGALEQQFQIRFPSSVREFFMAHDGASFDDVEYGFQADVGSGREWVQLECIYSLSKVRQRTESFQLPSSWNDRSEPVLPAAMIVLGQARDDIDMGPVILDLRPDSKTPGAIFFRHLGYDPGELGLDNATGLAYVAPSFEHFLDALRGPEPNE